MSGNDAVEIALGGIAGILIIAIAYGFLFAAFDTLGLSVAIVALLVVVGIAAYRRHRRDAGNQTR